MCDVRTGYPGADVGWRDGMGCVHEEEGCWDDQKLRRGERRDVHGGCHDLHDHSCVESREIGEWYWL